MNVLNDQRAVFCLHLSKCKVQYSGTSYPNPLGPEVVNNPEMYVTLKCI